MKRTVAACTCFTLFFIIMQAYCAPFSHGADPAASAPASSGSAPSGPAPLQKQEPLMVYAWVNYMPEWLTHGFTEETGIPVRPSFFAQSESMLARLTTTEGTLPFDLVTPSGEMVQEMAAMGLLQPLDKSKIPNMSRLDPWFSSKPYDEGLKYSAPMYWGVMGIVVDKRALPPDLVGQVKGYKDLWRPEFKGRLLLPNDFRSVMSVMLLTLGYSVNEQRMDRLNEALDKLATLAPGVSTWDTVDMPDSMAERNLAAAVCWGMQEFSADGGSHYRFIFPEEGSPLWVDTLAVPGNARNPEAAFAFINYILRPENQARLSKELGYAIAVEDARPMLPEDLRNNVVVYPPASMRSRFETEAMLPPESSDLEKRWEKIRAGQYKAP